MQAHRIVFLAVIASLVFLLPVLLLTSGGPRLLADDSNNFKPTAGVAVDWRIHKTTGSLLVTADGQDYVVSAAYRVLIEANSMRITDGNCYGGASPIVFPANLVRVGIVPEDANMPVVRFSLTAAASATTPALHPAGISSMPITKTAITAAHFYCAAKNQVTVYVMTPRN